MNNSYDSIRVFTGTLSRIWGGGGGGWGGQFSLKRIQGDAVGEINILGRHSSGRCEKEVHMDMCLILNYWRDRVA
jgi:hypothetical protein